MFIYYQRMSFLYIFLLLFRLHFHIEVKNNPPCLCEIKNECFEHNNVFIFKFNEISLHETLKHCIFGQLYVYVTFSFRFL